MSIALTEHTVAQDHPALLAAVPDGLNGLAAQSKHPVAVVIDEFQKVVEQGGTGSPS